MRMPTLRALTGDERGVALPMAMFVLIMLTSLSIAFLTLSQSEPVVANNQLRAAQARVLAEAGVERAIWALSNTTTSLLGMPLNGVSPAVPYEYDGLTFLTVSNMTGGFTVRITGGRCNSPATESSCATAANYPANYPAADYDGNTVTVEAEGWTPSVGRSTVNTYDESDTRSKSHRKIRVVLIRYPEFALNSPCALCVNGGLVVKGSAKIQANGADGANVTCPGVSNKVGVTTAGTLCLGGDNACTTADPQWGNTGTIFGNPALGGTPAKNETADYQTAVGSSTFTDNMTLSTGALDALRQMAKDQGSYFSGNQAWSGGELPSGKSVVFIDGNLTTTGNPYAGDLFTGWLIVIGSATLNGNGTIDGMLYVTNDVSSSSGTNVINGLVVSQNTTNASVVDSEAGGNMTINFDCAKASGSMQIPKKFFPKPGSWSEPSG